MADENNHTDDGVTEQETDDKQTQEQVTDYGQERETRGRKSNAEKELEELRAEKERTAQFLKKANKEAEKYRHEANRWKDLSEFGVESPDEIKSLLEEKREREIQEAEKAKDWEALKERWQEDYKTKEQKWQEQIESYQKNLSDMEATVESFLVDSQIKDAIVKNGGDELTLDLLTDKVKQKAKVERDETGQYKAFALDDEGNQVDFGSLVKNMKNHPTYSKVFPSPESSGSGGSKGAEKGSAEGNKQKKAPSKKRSDMNAREKQEFIREHGIAEYQQLPN